MFYSNFEFNSNPRSRFFLLPFFLFISTMENKYKLLLIIALPFLFTIAVFFFVIYYCYLCRRTHKTVESTTPDLEENRKGKEEEEEVETEDLMKFQGGEDLTSHDILEAPGEVIGKSSYGTLYEANLISTETVAVLRFLRPACAGKLKEVVPLIQFLGSVRHQNLVPLHAFYAGPRGEKLLVYPFLGKGNLEQFIRDGNGDFYKWAIIHKISIGIARGIEHLHCRLKKPLIHGNLKSKNVLLDQNYHPFVSDFGLHLLLNEMAGQELLSEGYKAPELIKMKNANESTDIYSLGVIFLELVTRKEPKKENDHDFYLPNIMRDSILNHPMGKNIYNSYIILEAEDKVLAFVRLALACCSPSPSHRPDIKQVLEKLEEIVR
ncbi:putative kinase-like protein TMKL1 [Impatiens glandulifera]|uniref:putative kinase-like protein TMKL1 n=1 Tax=Impatiens glandulifera TaxID=253017 RepID=UPI001FB07AEA|nr:putative kinase-like protein TMKL1 [Impatiens glandulifera]